jgi:predicted DCC family thiol-disulfide oxidoreductase YuxK
MLAACGLEGEDTVVLVEDGRCWSRSTAALKIAQRLDGGWPLLAALLAVPRPIRDAVYRFISHNRFRWFGTRDSCRMPTPDLQARFLAYDAPAI